MLLASHSRYAIYRVSDNILYYISYMQKYGFPIFVLKAGEKEISETAPFLIRFSKSVLQNQTRFL